jgi:hypothetical protein
MYVCMHMCVCMYVYKMRMKHTYIHTDEAASRCLAQQTEAEPGAHADVVETVGQSIHARAQQVSVHVCLRRAFQVLA